MDHHKAPRNHDASYSTSPAHYATCATDNGRAGSGIYTANSPTLAGEHRRIGQRATNKGGVTIHSAPEMRYREFPGTYGSTGSSNRHLSNNSGLKEANKNSTAASITGSSHGGGDSDKGLGFHNGSMAYSHATSGVSQMFPPPVTNPVVQTDNRLTEDYSRRIHCYISGDQDESSMQNDHMPPPVFPALQELRSDQDIPFWRPPRVLQQEPHYNRTYLPTSTRVSAYRPVESHTGKTDCLRLDGPDVQSSSNSTALGSASSLLSPALLAISNSHYEQQRRQHRQHQRPGRIARVESRVEAAETPQEESMQAVKHALGPANMTDGKASTGSTLPPIHVLTEGVSTRNLAANPAHTYRSHDGLYTLTSDGPAYKRARGEPMDHLDTVEGSEKGMVATRADGFGAHLPPIYSKYRHSKAGDGLLVHSTAATATVNPFASGASGSLSAFGGGTRESISIPCLVDNQRPGPTQEYLTATFKQQSTATGSVSALSLSDYSSGSRSLVLSNSQLESRKRSYGAADAAISLHRLARTELEPSLGRSTEPSVHATAASDDLPASLPQRQSLCAGNEVVITCYHASVAQKSYGGEKRFLCPPPAVLLCGDGYSAEIAHHSPMLLSVTADTEAHGQIHPSRPTPRDDTSEQNQQNQQNGTQNSDSSNSGSANRVRPSSSSHAPLECQTSFNERNVALFKSLHVTGMQKAKSFRLQLDLVIPTTVGVQLYAHDSNRWRAPDVYASLESDPVTIISKPSKKTAKARNQSTCIRAGSLISLFNRINSQTFRTKYLNVDHNTNRWVAQSHNWSPLEVVVISDNGNETVGNSRVSDPVQPTDHRPLFYGSEIVLVESRRNFQSPPMIIHKVERGRLVENARSPVSQMQKIALQLKPSVAGSSTQFLKADVGHYSPVVTDSGSNTHFDDPDGSPELTFEALENARISRTRVRDTHGDVGGIEIDDAFCWTIVGISSFTYSYSIPSEQPAPLRYISPIPRVSDISVTRGGELTMRAVNFDSDKMQLVLNKTALCSCPLHGGSMSTQGNRGMQQRRTPTDTATSEGRSALANKSEDSAVYMFQLPSDAQPGVLSIRRTDSVLYHTNWEIKLNQASRILEAVACTFKTL